MLGQLLPNHLFQAPGALHLYKFAAEQMVLVLILGHKFQAVAALDLIRARVTVLRDLTFVEGFLAISARCGQKVTVLFVVRHIFFGNLSVAVGVLALLQN